jgi:hypothetical protein
MRHNPLTELIAQQAEDRRKKKGKGNKRSEQKAVNEEKRERARTMPLYEQIADWRGIERVFEDKHNDKYPLAVSKSTRFDQNPLSRPGISLSPVDLIREAKPESVVSNIDRAIASARIALKPHLDRMAIEERHNATGTRRQHTQSTNESYRNHSEMLFKQYCAQLGVPDIRLISWPNFAEWLLSRQYDVSATTWRIYRAAIFSILEQMNDDETILAMAILKLEDDLTENASRNSEAGMNRIKKIKPDDYDRMIYHCTCRGTPNTQNLQNFLRATIRVGLRPKEFLTSEIRFIPDDSAPFGRQVWLFTCNAKYSNGRANGPIRAIDLSELNSSAIESINMCIADARTHTAMNGYLSWTKSLNNTMRGLANSQKTGIKESYTAYSARHQAIANWKSVYNPIAVAALAGHAFPDTAAAAHYGKEADAWAPERLDNVLVRPSSADIKRIENRLDMAKERRDHTEGKVTIKSLPQLK